MTTLNRKRLTIKFDNFNNSSKECCHIQFKHDLLSVLFSAINAQCKPTTESESWIVRSIFTGGRKNKDLKHM